VRRLPTDEERSLALSVTDYRHHTINNQPVPPMFEDRHAPDLEYFKNLLWRRRNVFLAIVGGFLTLVIGMTLMSPKTYTTTAKLIVGNSGGGGSVQAADATSSLPVVNALAGAAGVRSPETYVELIQEIPVAQRVIENLNLPTSPKRLLAGVNAKPVTDTQIVELSVAWSNPVTSAAIANEFAGVFVERERELIGDQATSALKFLSTKIPDAHADLQKTEQALADYERAHTGAFVNAQNQGVVVNLSALQTRLAQVQVDASQAKATLADVQKQLASTPPTENAATNVTVNPVVAGLQQQLAQVNEQLAAARKQYTEAHPAVIALRDQKAQLEMQIASMPQTVVAAKTEAMSPTFEKLREQAAMLEAQIASDRAQEKSLTEQGKTLLRTVKNLPTEGLALAELTRREKLSEEVYTTLEHRYNEALIARTASLSDVSITQPALAELAVKHPSLTMNGLIGLLIGLVLGITGVFLVEYFDNTVKDEADVARHLPLPVLASVPKVTEKNVKALPWLRAMTADAFLQLISALRYSSDQEIRTLAVMSPLEGDGKSTIAMNFAIALAEHAHGGALIIDADLRRPTLHQRLGTSDDTPGLSDILIGKLTADEAIVTTKYHGLSALLAGPPVPNPMRLFQTERFERLLEDLRVKYPFVIVDTPALLTVFDGTLIATKTDGAVIVVAAGHTDVRSTSRAIERLMAFGAPNLLGIVLNQTQPANHDYGYYTKPRERLQLVDHITPVA
jgi:succinoglycan biosynthesis transport protein ExoP